MLKTKDNEFHLVVPDLVDTGIAESLSANSSDVNFDRRKCVEKISGERLHDLVISRWRNGYIRDGFWITAKAKAYRDLDKTITRHLVVRCCKLESDGTRGPSSIVAEYKNGIPILRN